MERLTNSKLKMACDHFVSFASKEEKTKYRMMAESAPKYEEIYKKLAEYENAEEKGLLIKLPCKVGDKVYKIWSCGKNGKSIAEFRITHIDVDNFPKIEFSFTSTKNPNGYYKFCSLEDIGKTVFLKPEDAEKALVELNSKTECER